MRDLTWEIGVLLQRYANRANKLDQHNFDEKDRLKKLYAKAILLNVEHGYGLLMILQMQSVMDILLTMTVLAICSMQMEIELAQADATLSFQKEKNPMEQFMCHGLTSEEN